MTYQIISHSLKLFFKVTFYKQICYTFFKHPTKEIKEAHPLNNILNFYVIKYNF